MNLRIKELRAEAQELASQEHHTGRSLDLKGMEQQCPDFEIFISRLHTSYEKFAELIVKECAEVCYHHSEAAGGVDTAFGYGYKDCGNDIKKHFGVES